MSIIDISKLLLEAGGKVYETAKDQYIQQTEAKRAGRLDIIRLIQTNKLNVNNKEVMEIASDTLRQYYIDNCRLDLIAADFKLLLEDTQNNSNINMVRFIVDSLLRKRTDSGGNIIPSIFDIRYPGFSKCYSNSTIIAKEMYSHLYIFTELVHDGKNIDDIIHKMYNDQMDYGSTDPEKWEFCVWQIIKDLNLSHVNGQFDTFHKKYTFIDKEIYDILDKLYTDNVIYIDNNEIVKNKIKENYDNITTEVGKKKIREILEWEEGEWNLDNYTANLKGSGIGIPRTFAKRIYEYQILEDFMNIFIILCVMHKDIIAKKKITFTYSSTEKVISFAHLSNETAMVVSKKAVNDMKKNNMILIVIGIVIISILSFLSIGYIVMMIIAFFIFDRTPMSQKIVESGEYWKKRLVFTALAPLNLFVHLTHGKRKAHYFTDFNIFSKHEIKKDTEEEVNEDGFIDD